MEFPLIFQMKLFLKRLNSRSEIKRLSVRKKQLLLTMKFLCKKKEIVEELVLNIESVFKMEIDIIIISLLVLIASALYLYFSSSKDNEDNQFNKEDLKRINEKLSSVQTNSNQIQAAVQSFKNPMDSLNRYLSGSAISGVVGEWGLEAIITETLSSIQYEKDFMNETVEFAIKMPEENIYQ